MWVVPSAVGVEVGVTFGLPGTHLDAGLEDVVQVHEDKEVTRVTVAAGVVVLMNLDAVGVATHAHSGDLVVGEANVDELVALEAFLQIIQIGILV